ncbi:MAG: hypothetical protein LBC70_10895 [Chitinispirillales bacterium]|jgi:tetratricopeptide (TPR) repeat protein|nr:hypothetical protein [Chitinispirillales bacterium]
MLKILILAIAIILTSSPALPFKTFADTGLCEFRTTDKEKPTGELAFKIGRAYAETGVFDSAAVYLMRAIDANSNVAAARPLLAQALLDTRNFNAALPHAEFLSSQEPNNLVYLRMLAASYEGVDNGEKLAEIDRRIVALDQNDLPTRLRLARFAESTNDLAVAYAMYSEAAALDSRNPDLLKKLADLASRINQLAGEN